MIDFDPVETIAMFQQQSLADQFKVQGTFHLDEVMVTFLSGQTLATYSRIELLDFKEDYFELIQRQEGTDTDLLKYKACEIIALFAVDNDIKTRYHYGTDFTVDVNGSIKWTSTHKPADRKVYTVYYKYYPIYRAVKAMHRERFTQYNSRVDNIKAPKITVGENTYVKLPETWILKRDNLIERRDQDDNLLTENTYYDPNE
jgi:hypothetical protein